MISCAKRTDLNTHILSRWGQGTTIWPTVNNPRCSTSTDGTGTTQLNVWRDAAEAQEVVQISAGGVSVRNRVMLLELIAWNDQYFNKNRVIIVN